MAKVIEYLEVLSGLNQLTLLPYLKEKILPLKLKIIQDGVQMHCFEINDEWVVGHGMDNDKGFCRNYQSIFAL